MTKFEVVHVGLWDIDGISAETLDQFLHGCRVEGTHNRVTGLHRTKCDGTLNTPDLTDEDLVGTLTQGGFEEIEHRDPSSRAVPFPFAFGEGHLAYPVPVRDGELGVSSMVMILVLPGG